MPEDTYNSLRGLPGVICPRCRYLVTDPTEGRLPRCPHHPDVVLVPTSAMAAADGDPFLGMIVGERFAVLELLGAGSMGTVYRARQEAMGRDVALKIVRSDRLVDAQAVGRFQQEAHATSLLTSPHTVTVFDFGEITVEGPDPAFIDGSLFLAMELLDGESLGDRLKRVKQLTPDEAVRIIRHTLLSLAEAHEKGVIHRDLKPDNLLLVNAPGGDEEICKVLDFGIAKVLTHQGGIDALETQAGTVFGTPRYMSPEQAQGKQLDARSDLYSLAVILYHALLGRPPYTDSDAVVVMAHHIKTPPKRPSRVNPDLQIPQPLEDLLMRALDKKPHNRPQSAADFIRALDELGPVTPNTTAELTAVLGLAPLRGPSKRMMLAGAIALAALAAGGVGVAFSGETPQRASEGVASALGGVALRAVGEAQAEAPAGQTDARERAAASASTKYERSAPRAKPKKRRYERFDE